jgi:hypothetical protein
VSEPNWSTFESLPGAADRNFEVLCRLLMRRHFSRYGHFRVLAQQPGVEFDLRLERDCSLGEAGRWFGWQCRWYELPTGTAIGKTRREKIEEAIQTTERHFPKITDWVLWTRNPLTKGDQEDWFQKISTKMKLHLWTGEQIEEYLAGDGVVLRESFFGEWILTPETLAKLHSRSVSFIGRRWQREVHQPLKAERVLRSMLLHPESWQQLPELAQRLEQGSAELSGYVSGFPDRERALAEPVCAFMLRLATWLRTLDAWIGTGKLAQIETWLKEGFAVPLSSLRALPHRLRAIRSPGALIAPNAIDDVQQGLGLINRLRKHLSNRVVGVLAEAGNGKTELAAELTAPGAYPAGVLLQGSALGANQSLDDLARTLIVHGKPVPSMDALLAGLDAAGQRAGCRLPLIIDGLNEAQDPRVFKGALASLNTTLGEYSHVLVICTLRPAFAEDALPDGIVKLEIEGFGDDLNPALSRYLEYYRIDAQGVRFPRLINHPLILRLFCEVTNPTRDKTVGAEAMPRSLTALFERYFQQAAERIAQLSPATHRLYPHDVQSGLIEIGSMLWETANRHLEVRALKARLNDVGKPWNATLQRALEHEGILLRVPGDAPGAERVAVVYDLMAGHLVADAQLGNCGAGGLKQWLSTPATKDLLDGSPQHHPVTEGLLNVAADRPSPDTALPQRHPLAEDILNGLVGLTPRKFHRKHLWAYLDEPLRTKALLKTIRLEGEYLDSDTVGELAQQLSGKREIVRVLEDLWEVRDAPLHPLNAEFLDRVLRSFSVVERDLSWTEWLRRRARHIEDEIADFERWGEPSKVDDLRAQSVMWLLTSTNRPLRDRATHALYWYGRGSPAGLLKLIGSSLEINDPYVSERTLAAGLGVVFARRNDPPFCVEHMPKYGRKVFDAMIAPLAPHWTTHVLARKYARRIVAESQASSSGFLRTEELVWLSHPARQVRSMTWGLAKDRDEGRYRNGNAPLGLDFDNYTLGSLVEGRRQYNFEHLGYRRVRAQVLWRIYSLGYTLDAFSRVDQTLASENFRRYGRASDGGKTDRYGKKYAWIAFFELAGHRADLGLIEYREDELVDIDPSFPDPLPELQLVEESFLGDTERDTNTWILDGGVPNLAPYLERPRIGEHAGPWVMLDGYVNQESKTLGRNRFTFLRAFLVHERDASTVNTQLLAQGERGRWLPEKPDRSQMYQADLPPHESRYERSQVELSMFVGTETQAVQKIETVWFQNGVQVSFEEISESTLEDIKKLVAQVPNDQFEAEVEARFGITCFEEFTDSTETFDRFEQFNVTIPVFEGSWNAKLSAANPEWSVTVPSLHLFDAMCLQARPQSFDFVDEQGRLASLSFSHDQDSKNSQHFCFVRKDLLDQYLARMQLRLLWVIWGERTRSIHDFMRIRNDSEIVQYKVFQEISWYQDSLKVSSQAVASEINLER